MEQNGYVIVSYWGKSLQPDDKGWTGKAWSDNYRGLLPFYDMSSATVYAQTLRSHRKGATIGIQAYYPYTS